MQSDTLIIIPTYNESRNISKMIPILMQLENMQVDVLVVDDGSPDGTADIVRAYQKEYEGRVHLITRAGKLGLGTAYVEGFRYALARSYTFICEMDADFSHDPYDVPRLVKVVRAGEADLAIGSRYYNGISIINWPLSRLILSYSANVYARIITGMDVFDTTAGFKCFHRRVLESIDLNRIKSNGYSFQIELHFRAFKKGFRIKEVSVIFRERTEGVSKISKAIVIEAIWMVWALKLRSILGRL
ncbi:MAG: polyprenol monophosphomannose synthase [Bacteroidetes bacterium]|nr:polyprenol monophosphomannose synthase [Bacteroidota bacterium]MCH8524290.1 polyprenol monophosphomannose synthase [Balneolales bacterium]